MNFIKRAKEKVYTITFFFVYLDSVKLATERVAIRLSKGGHTIPADVIERRYHKGLKNFQRYAAETGSRYMYDNAGSEYELVAKSIKKGREIINFELFKVIVNNG